MRRGSVPASRWLRAFALALLLGAIPSLPRADDGRGLKRGADPREVSLSGVSSGAAMAVQYAVAHSASVKAVGSIAGPQWGCAQGSVSRAINVCMCGRQPTIEPTVTAARRLASSGAIDSLTPEGPRSLKRSYVFQSARDETVVERSGEANAAFLSEFTRTPQVLDEGRHDNGSDGAGHGIVAPGTGNDSCAFDGREGTFVRTCGAEDNAGAMFRALFAPGAAIDPSKRNANVPESEIWAFDQQALVDRVRSAGSPVSADFNDFFYFGWPNSSARRRNFDLAATGYLYVPPACRSPGSSCSVHVALHGCKQNAKQFALKAGYNNWADHYRVIVVYPAVAPERPLAGGVCAMDPVSTVADAAWIKPNPNGCWDWWGYLDPSSEPQRYLTKRAPQMRVIEAIIAEVTAQ